MEAWVPLFEIFLNSPSPESEASLWFQSAFEASMAATTAIPTTTASFVSLLMKPLDAIVVNVEAPFSSSSSSPSSTSRVLYIQTLPNMVQARILSFLSVEREKFCRQDLCRLARCVLSCDESLDFWVEKAARNLFDVLSDSSYEWISCLGLDSGEENKESVVDEFESVPDWLNSGASDLLPWLPMSREDLMSSKMSFVESGKSENGLCEDGGQVDELMSDVANEVEVEVEVEAEIEMVRSINVPLGHEVLDEIANLKQRIMDIESTSETIDLAREICKLCCDDKRVDNPLAVLGLIEPWVVDDETASVFVSHLLNGREGIGEKELVWPTQVLCSVILPKLLFLEEPASRVLVASTTNFCKVHQRAAESGLLLPLFLCKDGINNSICDVVTKIVKECLHTAHVSAVCQKLLCGGKEERRPVCLPCHCHLISNELVWTESLFNFFLNILNHNVCLTQDSVSCLVYQVQHLAEKFSISLKFGNFLLCFVAKCSSLLKSHKVTLIEAVKRTNTLVTKSTLSKLASI